MYENHSVDYYRLNRVGGWLYLLIFRLFAAACMALISILYAPSLQYSSFIPLFCSIFAVSILTIVLLFRRARAFRISYIIFSILSILDYVFAQNAMGFVACMVVEACWILYLLVSVRVKLVLGIIQPPEETAESSQ